MALFYKLYIYGAGGHGRVILASAAEMEAVAFQGFIDDAAEPPTKNEAGVLLPSIFETVDRSLAIVIVGIGDNAVREQVQSQLHRDGLNTVSVIDAKAHVVGELEWGHGIYVGPFAAINVDAEVNEGVIVNTAAVVEHDCHIDAFAHIAPNATLCGGVEVGKRTLVGAGAVVIPNIKIGDDCVVGAGAVVTKDVPNNATVVGNPARLVQSSGYPHDEHDHMTGDGTILA